MINIPEHLMFSVLRIESLDNGGNVDSIGTGFLLSRPIGNRKYKIYLVSCKHILADTDNIRIVFTANKHGSPDIGKIQQFPITQIKNNVVSHPDPAVDVAVLECTGLFNLFPGSLYFTSVPYDILSTFNEPELTIAENIYFIGYPDDRYDEVNNLPLVRTGLIASHPKYDYNGYPKFVIDAQVFPGSSGSPVFIDLAYENFKNGEIIIGGRKIRLLGIVASTMIRNNELQAVSKAEKYTTQEVLGLGLVFKATTIKELIDTMPIDN